jgi:hypothetical protein
MDVSEISAAIESEDPAQGLRAALALHRLAERVEAHQVAVARTQGWSWQQIGDALGCVVGLDSQRLDRRVAQLSHLDFVSV